MNVLGAIMRDPSTVETAAVSALRAMTAFDTTNLRLSFTVPDHGMVGVILQVGSSNDDVSVAPPVILLGVLEGSTVRGRMLATPTQINTTGTTGDQNILKAEFIISGLTPGPAVWDAAYGVEIVVANMELRWGGPNDTTGENAYGAFQFVVYDPAPHTQSVAESELEEFPHNPNAIRTDN